ncbi:MAG TPA: hypothetical protein VFD36_16545, partial [Kofleriaceae bacterium]|nr:hypothetical protein [Kofleriaceae bacterium]
LGCLLGPAVHGLPAREPPRARMHALLAELATLDSELKELERASQAAAEAARTAPSASASGARTSSNTNSNPLDDALSDLKRRAGSDGARSSPSSNPGPGPRAGARRPPATNVDDDLAELKRKMAAAPPKKKP